MHLPIKYKLFALLLIFTILASACGTTNSSDAVATHVALTVQAQSAQQKVTSPIPVLTGTPIPPTLPSGTAPSPQPKPPTFPPATGKDLDCAKASLVEDKTIPDGTILKPGEQFIKIWRIQNTSNCVWDTNYKIVFWDGELMGGGYVYNFPQQALPGDIVDVPLVLTAPTTDGSYKSYWKLQTPGGTTFGVGYNAAFWADIVVSSSTKVDYGVTSVTYSIDRSPATGCPANVFFTIFATISVNGPVSVTYNWRKSDGALEDKKTIKFTAAGSKTVSMNWSIHYGSSTNDRWAQLFTVSPIEQDFGKAVFSYDCH